MSNVIHTLMPGVECVDTDGDGMTRAEIFAEFDEAKSQKVLVGMFQFVAGQMRDGDTDEDIFDTLVNATDTPAHKEMMALLGAYMIIREARRINMERS